MRKYPERYVQLLVDAVAELMSRDYEHGFSIDQVLDRHGFRDDPDRVEMFALISRKLNHRAAAKTRAAHKRRIIDEKNFFFPFLTPPGKR